jgi:general secretion pathway protein G
MRKIIAMTSLAMLGGALALGVWRYSTPVDSVSLVASSLASIEGRIEQFQLDQGRLPSSLQELLLPSLVAKTPYATAAELRDPWGRELYYQASGDTYLLFTLGADGQVGGSGNAKDLQVGSAVANGS